MSTSTSASQQQSTTPALRHVFGLTGAGRRVLKETDHDKLFRLLKGAAPSWGNIANELNFTFEDKRAINLTPGLNDDEGYFQAVLHRWLKREPHLTTVEVLANALHLAGEHRLAHDLEHDPDLMDGWMDTLRAKGKSVV